MKINTTGITKITTKKVLYFLALIVILNSFVTIGAGQRGVLLQFGAVQDRIMDEGIHLKVPFVQKVRKIDVRIQKDEVQASAASKDLQDVSSVIALNYRLIPSHVNKLWQEVGQDYDVRIISPVIQESVKAITARYTAEELITKRQQVREDIRQSLFDRLAVRGIEVIDFNIVDFNFSPSFNAAIESKVTAEQLKLKADRDLERIKVEAQQRIEDAQGKAKAIQIEGEALRQSPQVVELRWIEKWNGEVPQFWGGATPFIGIK
jgi:regulator of protease activity HflC (stomatin/prohibitin superfamily)